MRCDREYPEHEKLRAVQDKSHVIGEFMDWLHSKERYVAGYHTHTEACYGEGTRHPRTCGLHEDFLYSIDRSIPKLLAEYFDIDLDKLEQEKQDMLEDLRRVNEALDKAEEEAKDNARTRWCEKCARYRQIRSTGECMECDSQLK